MRAIKGKKNGEDEGHKRKKNGEDDGLREKRGIA